MSDDMMWAAECNKCGRPFLFKGDPSPEERQKTLDAQSERCCPGE